MQPSTQPQHHWPSRWHALAVPRSSQIAILLCLVCIALLGSGPVADGDLWWQMAYGRYFLDNATLIPDHTLFSWTPSSGDTIYCAWLAEILLYLLYDLGGLPSLFGLRYLSVLMPGVLVLWLAQRYYRQHTPLLWLAVLLCYLVSSTAGSLLKPEIFSFLLTALTLANYFALKADSHNGWWRCYLFPLMMLVWVNTHGGFIVGMVLLACIGLGELCNYLANTPTCLSKRGMQHLGIAALLTGLALLLNPYGIDYPVQVVGDIINLNKPHYASVVAYQSVFSPRMWLLRNGIYLYVMLGLCLPLFAVLARKKQPDLALLLLNLVFIYLYITYGRLTYFYALVFLFTLQYQLAHTQTVWQSTCQSVGRWFARWARRLPSKPPASRVVYNTFNVVVLIGILFAGGHRLKDRIDYPSSSSWFDFGISSANPVDETDYIETYVPQQKLCNDYDGGGYLLWKLWPRQQVMIDPRYFPYAAWFDDYIEFIRGRNVEQIIAKFDCDIWYTNYRLQQVVDWLNASPQWQPIFYGRAGILFARSALATTLPPLHHSVPISTLKNPRRFIIAIRFALNHQEFAQASDLAGHYTARFSYGNHQALAVSAKAHVDGVVAYHLRDYRRAIEQLSFATTEPAALKNPGLLLNAHHLLSQQQWQAGDRRAALSTAQQALEHAPYDLIARYNVGMLSAQLFGDRLTAALPSTVNWHQHLNRFVQLAAANPNLAQGSIILWQSMQDNAQRVLRGETVAHFPPAIGRTPPPLPPREKRPQ